MYANGQAKFVFTLINDVSAICSCELQLLAFIDPKCNLSKHGSPPVQIQMQLEKIITINRS
jgi:hypothetical protein